jgi:hypothetical protein
MKDKFHIFSGMFRGAMAGGAVAHLVRAGTVTVLVVGHPVTIPLTLAWVAGGAIAGGLTAKIYRAAQDAGMANALHRMEACET